MKHKKTKIRRRFGDTAQPVEPDNKTLPGIAGDTDKAKRRNTSKLCTGVLHGKDVEIPEGQTKRKLKAWCVEKMVGKPFPVLVSSAAKKVCEGLPRAECRKAILAQAGETAVGFKTTLAKVVSKGSPLVTETVRGRKLVPVVGSAGSASCRPPGKGGKGDIRDCHYELEFLDAATAAEKKLPGPGPYLRVCPTKEKFAPGALYAVSGPKEAKQISDAYCECRKEGAAPDSCLNKVAPPLAFGRTSTNRFGLFGYKKGR